MNNSFEFILVKDPHFQYAFRNNIRLSGWEKDIDHKINQIISYMTDHSIKNLFFTGDVFDKSKRKDWSFSQFQANMERLRWFKDAGIKIYSNLGNHDLSNGGRESIEDTIFEMAVELGLLNYIGSGMDPIKFPVGNIDKDNDGSLGEVLLFGVDYHLSPDKINYELQSINDFPRGLQSSKLVLMHSNITSNNTRLTDFTYEQLSGFDIDMIGCGHYHLVPEGGAIQSLNGTTFLNPFNLSRVARDYLVKMDEHRPEFIHTKITFLPGVKPQEESKEIFLDVKKFSEAFSIETIKLELEEDLSDDDKLLENLARINQITEKSIKLAKELLC